MKRLFGYWRAYAACFSTAYSVGAGAFVCHAERRFIVTHDDALDVLYLRLLAPAVVTTIGVTVVTVFLAFYSPVISLTTGLMLIIASVVVLCEL
jgi:hypothetical protein